LKLLWIFILSLALFITGCAKTQQVQPAVNTNEKSHQEMTYYTNKIAVLEYHHFQDPPVSSVTISPQEFEHQVRFLRQNGFHFISFRQMEDFLYRKGHVPTNAVVVTTDDGYLSVWKQMYPVVVKEKVPVMNFLITSRIVKQRPNETPKMLLTDLEEAKKSPWMAFGAHTHDLHREIMGQNEKLGPALVTVARGETNQGYHNRVKKDLVTSYQMIQKLQKSDSIPLAFPYGAYNPEVLTLARQIGFTSFVTTHEGLVGQEAGKNHLINRIEAGTPRMTAEKLMNTILRLNEESTPKK
jgi:peptidoglycan/xylan/chitin deacetylase (PgdA/CDA1 family)